VSARSDHSIRRSNHSCLNSIVTRVRSDIFIGIWHDHLFQAYVSFLARPVAKSYPLVTVRRVQCSVVLFLCGD